MSKRGALLLSNFRSHLQHSNVRQFERCAVRLAPVTTTFARLVHLSPDQQQLQQHRKFASSSGSSGDDDKTKLEEHRKQTDELIKKLKAIRMKARHESLASRVDRFTYRQQIQGDLERALIHQRHAEKEFDNHEIKANMDSNLYVLKNRTIEKNMPVPRSSEDIGRLTLSDLRARLRERGLSVTGRKQTLIERLEAATTTTHTTTAIATSANLSPTQRLWERQTLSAAPGSQQQLKGEQPQPHQQQEQQQQRERQQHEQQLVNYTATNAVTACGNKSVTQLPQNDDVSLEYVNGMPHLTIRLPSRNELCQFALKPISHTVGHLLAMLREEDRGIDRAAVINKNGVRIASSCSIERLLDDDFCIQINNRSLAVHPPVREKITLEAIDKMGDVRKIIAQLYEAFNVGEYQLEKSHQLNKELESLRYELEPLEEKKNELARKAQRRTNMMTWVGLGLMSVQFGILARLTWWEYSWDIMEPVTYFVTYGTTMAMYAYYCVTKREYILENVYNREYSLNIYKNAKKAQFDVEHYNQLKRRSAELEYNLSRLNDPINMELPAHLVRTQLSLPPKTEICNTDENNKTKCT